MAEQEFMEILNDCIQRLANGQSIEDCVRLYPAHGTRLRRLLEAGVVVGQMAFPLVEVVEDQALVWQNIERGLQGKNSRRTVPLRFIVLLAAVMVLMIGTALAVYSRIIEPSEPLLATLIATSTATPTVTQNATITATASSSLTPTETVTMTPTNTATTTPTITATRTPTATITVTRTPSITPTLTQTRTPTSTHTATTTHTPQTVTVIIEGIIEAINDNVLIIYGLEVYVAPDNLLLPNLRVGDTVYIEGRYEGTQIIAIEITLIVDDALNENSNNNSNDNQAQATPVGIPEGNDNTNDNDDHGNDNNDNDDHGNDNNTNDNNDNTDD